MDMIRGKPLEEALRAVDFSPRRASRMVAKLLRSALANADEQEADLELLYVVDARADQGPVLKRVQPRARGAADILHRPTCHLTVELEETAEV
mgnify:CR=1 FL=1